MINPRNIVGWLASRDSGCTYFQATGSIDFVNAQGPVRSASKTETSACAHFGLSFNTWEVTTAPGTIEFSGLKFSMTVDSYDNLTSRDYRGPWLYLFAERYEIGREQVAEVPEPASLGLLALGVAAFATSRRRKASAK